MTLAILADLVKTYLKLGQEGRAFARRLHSSLNAGRGKDKAIFGAALADPASRRGLLRSLRRCDACFNAWIPVEIPAVADRTRSNAYRRWIPYAWLSLEIQGRLLEAFGISMDKAAAERSILGSFIHREGNDVRDRMPLQTFLDLLAMEDGPNPAAARLVCLFKTRGTVAPKNLFPKYYELMAQVPGSYRSRLAMIPDPDGVLPGIHGYFLIQFHLVLGEVPEVLDRALRPFSMWFFGLDRLADLERDRAAGRLNFLARAADPEKEVAKFLEDCESLFRKTAVRPDRILRMMRVMTDRLFEARAEGLDVEQTYFHG